MELATVFAFEISGSGGDGGFHIVHEHVVLPRAHREKAGFFGKDNNSGENRGSKKKGRPNMR